MAAAGIYAREFSSLDRYVQFGVAGDRVISLSFPRDPAPDAETDHPLFSRIDAYVQGTPEDFSDVAVGLTVPTVQRDVLETLRTVPYGESVTVEQLTRMVPSLDPDDESDRAEVRDALAANPVPLLIPDHRVEDGPSAAPAPVVATLRRLEEF